MIDMDMIEKADEIMRAFQKEVYELCERTFHQQRSQHPTWWRVYS